MTSGHSWQQVNKRIKVLIAACFTFTLLCFVFSTQALAHEHNSGPMFQVKAGFESHYRNGNWVPVQVTLRNDGPDFSGTLLLLTPSSQFQGSSNQAIPTNFQDSISLANGAQKQVNMYLPLYFDVQKVTVKLLDASGNTIGFQTAPLTPLLPGDILIGILSDQNSGFSSLSALPLPNQGGSIVLESLNANTLPTLPAALKNFNIVVLDNFTTSNLSTAQVNALQTWINQGGKLILVGGPEWHRTFSTLPAGLVPLKLSGSMTIPAGTLLLPPGGQSMPHPGQKNTPAIPAPVSISAATLPSQGNGANSEVILTSGTTPLIVQAHKGQGTIIYLAFDPTLEPILGWQGASLLWDSLLFRSLGDQLLSHAGISSSIGSSTQQAQPILATRMSGFLQSMLPTTIPPPWRTLAILLLCYILVLGPVRFLLVKQLKGHFWSWRIILSSIVIFSLLSFGLAYIEKGSSILRDSISIAQLNQNGSSAHITTYMGVFVPNQGDYKIHFPGSVQAQPSPDAVSFPGGTTNSPTGSHTTISPLADGTDVKLQDVNIWTLHTILAEQDHPIHRGLVSQLALQNGSLVGTVTNTLGYALSDSFLLLRNDAYNLGNLAAGETKHVQLKLSSIPLVPNSTLADQIALDTNSPTYDDPSFAQPQSTWQRHMAILYALDGEGFFNFSPVCTGLCNGTANPLVPLLPFPPGINFPSFSNSSITGNSIGITPTAGWWEYAAERQFDPLLVSGSQATLIGWAENPPDLNDHVTINDSNPAGLHETLIQAPLSINLTGSLNLPPNFITGQLIDVASNNVQLRFPGVYSISTGSMTFEYVIPKSANLHVKGLTITEPQPPANIGSTQTGLVSNAGSSPFRLYNWRTDSWDTISLNQNSFTTNSLRTYMSATGRVLVQFINNDNQNGSILFGKPTINLQGDSSD